MEKEPKVSIITPCYNREKFIAETLECLRNMNYTNWECIIVDDGSTDQSAAIIKEFVKKDSRFKYYHHSNSGISITKNVGIAHSTGKYILPVDSDDLISPNYVPEAIEMLESRPEVKIVTAAGVYFGAKKGKWHLADYSFDELLISNCIHNSSMFRREDFDMTGGYDPSFVINEDWDLWINMLKTGGEVVRIEKDYFFYRKHKESNIIRFPKRDADLLKQLYEKNKDQYAHLLENPILLLFEHRKFKARYNTLRRITFRKPLK